MSRWTYEGFKLWVFLEKGVVFSRKAEGREEGATATIGPCVPIILCAPLAYIHLLAEEKWQMPQVVRENGVTKFVKSQML